MEVVLPAIASARWIWTTDDPSANNVWVYARRTFDLANTPVEASLHVTADLRYVAWANGIRIGFGPPKMHVARPTLDTYTITHHLRSGRNEIVLLVYSVGVVEDISSVMPCRGAILGAIDIDGRIISTNKEWKVARENAYLPNALQRCGQPHMEVFDARQSLGEPAGIGYDDSSWCCATELSDGPLLEPYRAIEPRDIPHMPWQFRPADRLLETGLARFGHDLQIDNVTTTGDDIRSADRMPDEAGRVIHDPYEHTVSLHAADLSCKEGVYARWDFGNIWTGYPVIEVEGTPGTVIDMSYAEHLTNGTVDPQKFYGLNYFDRIIVGNKPVGHRIMMPKSLRYLQAEVRGGSATIRRIGMEISSYPLHWQGSFNSSDAVLDHAWRASVHTMQLCTEDSFMDTPYRERGTWLGDIIATGLAHYRAFGDTQLIRRFLRLHADGQFADGSMAGKYPGKTTSHIPTWTLTYAILIDNYMHWSGDRSVAAQFWDTCWRNVQWLEAYRTPEGVYGNFPLKITLTENFYTFIDWAPVDTSGANAAFNAFAYWFFGACERIAIAAGDPVRAAFCRQRRTELAEAFTRVYWDDTRGIFVNGLVDGKPLRRWGCHENYLAVLLGLASTEQRSSIIRRLKQEDLFTTFVVDDTAHDQPIWSMAIGLNTYRWDDEKMVPLGSPWFTYFAASALCEIGAIDDALGLIRRHWGNFAKQGATTVWEVWDNHGTMSHAWSCAPAYILTRYVLGISDAADGAMIEVLPQRADLTTASGRAVTRFGVVQVQWKWDSSRWSMSVYVPSGSNAIIGFPANDCNGPLHLNGQPTPTARVARGDVGFNTVVVPAGQHHLAM